MNRILFSVCIATVLALSGCSEPDQQPKTVQQSNQPQTITDSETTDLPNPDEAPTSESEDDTMFGDRFPEVLAVDATLIEKESWRFSVTLSSTYDSPQRYADAWRVLNDNDEELGIRILGHDHASEQPFTRSGTIQVPADVDTVFVEGRDQENGWSGQRFESKLP